MNIKKKVQHVIWRACHNKFPMGSSLRKKGMEVDETCKLCGEEKEIVKHLFFHCAIPKIIQKLAPVNWDGLNQQTNSFKDWWSTLGNVVSGKELNERQELIAYMEKQKQDFHIREMLKAGSSAKSVE